MLYDATDSLYTQPLWQAAAWVTIFNVGMFVAALAAGEVLTRRFARNRVAPLPGGLTRTEIGLAVICVGLNAVVAIVGLVLWREGVIGVRPYGVYSAATVLLDTLVLFVAMDFAMYLFHRAAHHPAVYSLAHRSHHVYESPRPLSLFVLNPIEVLGFGALWIVVITLYTASIEGILAYLAFNLAFGLVAHLGVEPAPGVWVRVPLLRYISTSTFHTEHHMDRFHNYGFYLLVWDRLFGTLSPDYLQDFSRATGAQTSTAP
ncbi:MAG TPA: sterol desaturase family protein [Dehalococcoidia bacterium]|nr:sterol desaturase family protein [Dehalococcoidia bacterium]